MSRVKGALYETLAADYLSQKGYRILEKNYTTKFGEIDIVAIDSDTLVFVEVKYRASSSYGMGYEAVRHQKLRKLQKAIWHYIKANACYLPNKYRLDVISIDGPELSAVAIQHFTNVPMAT